MRKVKVSTGIFWVEIPKAGMRILCGCPADAVKHLMKKGFIAVEEKTGVTCETGPNAILLSDVPLQNERFANLAEFPVLQMLYKQGLILPNHPNNTGEKPLIIGVEEEVKSQVDYIYCGNYGLTTIEEIVKTGVTEDEAEEMMRLKRKFAFGKIKKTEELIEMRIMGAGPVEIRNGVVVQHLGLNVFEISHGGKSVTVNLNLAHDEEYEPAYNLGYHEVKREYFSVIHSGEGDGWDINRPCMASILTFQGKIYLIDAGPNLLHSLQALGIGVNEIEGIFHTHAHDDHFNGLTILLRSDHKIKYYATPLVRASVMKKLSILTSMDESMFFRYFDVIDLEADKWNSVDGLEVMPVYSPHPLETTVMFFRALWDDGYKTYAHLADTTGLNVLKGMITDDPAKDGVTLEYFDRIKEIYMTPVCLKKIDVGGGLIHGDAEDFKSDKSRRIILSHTSSHLTDAQKEIGESTTFGASNVFIAANQDYSKALAYHYFQAFFTSAPPWEIRMLLNCPEVSFNPGSIMVARGEVNKNIYLVLSGLLEFIVHELGINNKLTAGSMAGELSGLMGTEARGTYRAVSYVKALEIPSVLYVEFLKRNGMFDFVKKDIGKRRFLQSTWLFGDRLPCPLKSRIAQVMKPETFSAGRMLPVGRGQGLFLLEDGEISVMSKEKEIEKLKTGDFFGEESIFFEETTLLDARVVRQAKVYRIPSETIVEIPIVQLKLIETVERRLRAAGPQFVFA